MSGRPQPMSEDRFDTLLRGALTVEANRMAASQPIAESALADLAVRVRSHGVGTRRPLVATLAWLALLMVAAVTAAVVGSWLLRQPSNPIVLGPFGPPSPCGATPIADGMAVQAFRDEAVLFVDRSGLVTTLTRNAGDGPPEGEGGHRSRIESRFVTGVLTPSGTELVLQRITGLDVAPGCYRVRTQGGDAAIYANTAQGPIGLSFSWGNGEGDMAPLVAPVEQARLHELLDSLFALDTWVPADAFTRFEPSDLTSWIVHTTFRPTGFERSDVVDLGDGVVASASDGRYAAIRLPGGVSVEDFGSPIPGGPVNGQIIIAGYVDVRAPVERCGILRRSDAMTLAESLDRVSLNVPDKPDLFSPDLATGITIRLHPAVGAHATCVGFAEAINSHVQPFAEPTPPVVGDLATVDPCAYVPLHRFGVVESGWWSNASSPFGVEARPCVVESHSSMATGLVQRRVWLYPRSVTEDEARSLAAWIFGDGHSERRIDGSPSWLNHCLVGGLTCHHAIAGYTNGRLVLIEISDRASSSAEGASELMGEVLRSIR